MSSITCNLTFFFTLTLFFVISTSSSKFHTCTQSFLTLTKNNNLTKCRRLTTLGAEFGWEISQNNRNEINFIFGTKIIKDMGWIAWGVNPGKLAQMVGTRAIIGIKNINGSLYAKTYNITSGTKLGCKLEPTNFQHSQNEVVFQNVSMKYIQESDLYVIQAKLVVPAGHQYNRRRLNHVWQVGYDLEGDNPKKHPFILQNFDSTETINLETGKAYFIGKRFRHHLRKVHGILSILGWGTVLPAGALVARYLKYPLESLRLQIPLHKAFQIIGYILGVSGWAVGLVLSRLSKFYIFRTHRLYAIFIFTFATLQMSAFLLRPKTSDQYLKYWYMYHHCLGYGLLAVISINIFHGIDILKPNDIIWKWVYIGIVVAFAAIVTIVEIYSWIKFKRNQMKINQGRDQTATTIHLPQPSK